MMAAASAPRLTGGLFASVLLHGGVIALLVFFAAPRALRAVAAALSGPPDCGAGRRSRGGRRRACRDTASRVARSGSQVEDAAEDQTADEREDQAGATRPKRPRQFRSRRLPSLQSRRLRRRPRAAVRLAEREPMSRMSTRRASSSRIRGTCKTSREKFFVNSRHNRRG